MLIHSSLCVYTRAFSIHLSGRTASNFRKMALHSTSYIPRSFSRTEHSECSSLSDRFTLIQGSLAESATAEKGHKTRGWSDAWEGVWRVDNGKKCVSHARILQTVLEKEKLRTKPAHSSGSQLLADVWIILKVAWLKGFPADINTETKTELKIE